MNGWTDKTILAEKVSEKKSETEAVFNHLVVFLFYIVMSMFTFLWFGLNNKLFFVLAVHIMSFNYPEFPYAVLLLHTHANHIFCLTGSSPSFLSVSVCCHCLTQLVSPAYTLTYTHSQSTCIIAPWRENLLVVAVRVWPCSLPWAADSWHLVMSVSVCVWGCMCQNTENQCVRIS